MMWYGVTPLLPARPRRYSALPVAGSAASHEGIQTRSKFTRLEQMPRIFEASFRVPPKTQIMRQNGGSLSVRHISGFVRDVLQ